MELLFLLLFLICKPKHNPQLATQASTPAEVNVPVDVDAEVDEATQANIQPSKPATTNFLSRFFGKLFFIALGCDIVIVMNIYSQLKGL